MGCCNHPPYLRNRLFPMSVQALLRVMSVSDPVPIDLEVSNIREGWILDSTIDQQGGAEVHPLMVQPLLYCILSRSCSHGFLRSMDIMQESSSGVRE